MIHSASGVPLPGGGLVIRPPFRAPHHTSSLPSLVGGGSHALRPGEISLAHGGVLFLDEMGQFPQQRARRPAGGARGRAASWSAASSSDRVPMPARFQLIGATNPCPCGGGAPGACECDETLAVALHRPSVGPAARPLRPARRRRPARRSTSCSAASRASRRRRSLPRVVQRPPDGARTQRDAQRRARRARSQRVRTVDEGGRARCCTASSSAGGSPPRAASHPARRAHARRPRRRRRRDRRGEGDHGAGHACPGRASARSGRRRERRANGRR